LDKGKVRDMKRIIGIAGKARSGKDSAASYLFAAYGFTRIALADPLKLAAQQMFGLTDAQTWSDAVKEEVIPFWGLSPRQMFQRLGSDAVKPVFGNDHWVKRFKISYALLKDTDRVVVPDIRFEYEADMIRDLGGLMIHITRDSAAPVSAHVSEAGILHKPGDVSVSNNFTLQDFYDALDKVVDPQ
jgi:hypothetical protein